jgi:hypothetical protein
VVPQKRIYRLDSECTHTSKLVESLRYSMLKPPMLTHHLFSLTTFSAKCTPCMLIYSILSIYLIPLSNQTQEWNQPIIFFISNRTRGWNQPVPLEWNHDITFYLVPKQINQTHPKCLSSKSSLGLDRVFLQSCLYIYKKMFTVM